MGAINTYVKSRDWSLLRILKGLKGTVRQQISTKDKQIIKSKNLLSQFQQLQLMAESKIK